MSGSFKRTKSIPSLFVPIMLAVIIITPLIAVNTLVFPFASAQNFSPMPSLASQIQNSNSSSNTTTTTTTNTTSTQASDNNSTFLPKEQGFSVSVLAANFSSPYNILYGPDDALWITERTGKDIVRVDPNTGEMLSRMSIPNVYQTGGQDGVMGMAFDPDFSSSHFLYVAYTYLASSSPSSPLSSNSTGKNIIGNDGTNNNNPTRNNTTGETSAPSIDDPTNPDRLTKITRFTYHEESGGALAEPKDLISGLTGSVDHNSGRLLFGEDGKLYYTTGDRGNNQLSRYCLPIRAQMLPTEQQIEEKDWTAYEGKVLRMNSDGSIPDDNPVINGVKSHIFTYGHRNPQGLTLGLNGNIYSSEHGDKSDDEFNRLVPGGNYGWPYVAGYKDDMAYQFANWTAAGANCKELKWTNIPPFPSNVPVRNESQFNATNFVPPLHTFYTVGNDYNFSRPEGCGYICWPTVAPSSTHFYTSDKIPGWKNTFLMTTLKSGVIFQIRLNGDGTGIVEEPRALFHSENRYRDLAFSPDGSTIYVITDSAGPVQSINKDSGGEPITTVKNPGSLLVFRFEGTAQ